MIKKIAFIIFTVQLLSSCVSYQFATIESKDLPMVETHGYHFENNDIRIYYSFNGLCTPMSLEIENLSNKPITIDWSKSAYMINSYSYNYYNKKGSFSGEYQNTIPTRITGDISFNEESSFIPIQSKIKKSTPPLACLEFDLFSAEETVVKERDEQYNNIMTPRVYYNSENTPLKIENYLTYKIGEETTEQIVRHKFEVTKIVKSNNIPLFTKANQSFVRNGDPNVAFGLGLIALSVSVILIILTI